MLGSTGLGWKSGGKMKAAPLIAPPLSF